MNYTFIDYLNQAIKRRNLTQKEAAKLIHISPQTLSNYLLHKRTPDLKTMIHIMQVFHMDANRIFQLTPDENAMILEEAERNLIMRYRSLPSHVQITLQEIVKKLSEGNKEEDQKQSVKG